MQFKNGLVWAAMVAISMGLGSLGCSDEEGRDDAGVHDDSGTTDDANGGPINADGPDVNDDQDDANGGVVGCDPSAQPLGGGSGSASDPYLVCAPAHLTHLADTEDFLELDNYFLMTADIDMSGIDDFGVIGDNDPLRFSGEFDGGGFAVQNLTIDRESEEGVGLFGWIDETGIVENLVIDDVDIVGDDRVGGLAGYNRLGTVLNSHVSGEVRAVSGAAGGLVGENDSEVSDSSASAAVVNGGGLVGHNRGDGEITTSVATGDVEAQFRAGGLVARNSGTIVDSYATSRVDRIDDSTPDLGGLVGLNGGTIETSYAAGFVDSEADDFGGLVGSDDDGTVSNAYWDEDTTGVDISAGGEGLNTADFDDEANFEGWDFGAIWNIDTAPDGEMRPVLQWQ